MCALRISNVNYFQLFAMNKISHSTKMLSEYILEAIFLRCTYFLQHKVKLINLWATLKCAALNIQHIYHLCTLQCVPERILNAIIQFSFRLSFVYSSVSAI